MRRSSAAALNQHNSQRGKTENQTVAACFGGVWQRGEEW
jgi:hypothetical protein